MQYQIGMTRGWCIVNFPSFGGFRQVSWVQVVNNTWSASLYRPVWNSTHQQKKILQHWRRKSTVESLVKRLWLVQTGKTIQWLNGRDVGCSAANRSIYCSNWKLIVGGWYGKRESGFDCWQSVNGSMAKQMVLLDSRRRIGLFTT